MTQARRVVEFHWDRVLAGNRDASCRAASIAAAALPAILLFPASRTLVTAFMQGARWPLVGELPAAILLVATFVCELCERYLAVRWLARSALVAQGIQIALQALDHNFRAAVGDIGLFGAILVMCLATSSSERTRSGHARIGHAFLTVLAGGFATVGFLVGSHAGPLDLPEWLLPGAAGTVVVAALVTMLSTTTGRALAPLFAMLCALCLIARYESVYLGNFGPTVENWGTPTLSNMIVLLVAPFAAFTAVRLVAAAIDRGAGHAAFARR